LNLRPHIKTHKVPAIAKMQIESGAVGITSAKVSEAEIMADAGIKDILIAYPIYGERKLKRLMNLAEKVEITVALDSVVVAEGISKKAKETGKKLGILVEADVVMHRCGWKIGEEFVDATKNIRDMPGLDLKGVMVYPGYISEKIDPKIEGSLGKLAEDINRIYDLFNSSGIEINVLSGGSTPSAFLSHKLKGLTEIRPGTYVYNDMNTIFWDCAEEKDCALKVLTTVVSTTVKGQIIIDAGSKTMSGDTLAPKKGRGFGKIVGYENLFIKKMNEEHGYVDISGSGEKFKVGDKLLVIPNHCCSTNNMHDEAYGIRNNKVELSWKIAARGKLK
ncbi:alanine racemase, partial [candidate division KSB1 bacterium]